MKKTLICAIIHLFVYTHSVAQCVNISTIAGGGQSSYSGGVVRADTTSLYQPQNVAVDDTGNVFIAAFDCIYKITKQGMMSVFAGNFNDGFSGDGGPATLAKLYRPSAVAADNSGNVYIADSKNNRVRKVDRFGVISTFAGTGVAGYSGDGGVADSAKLNFPRGVAVDKFGNVYIVDYNNYRIRKVDPNGIVSNFAGNGTAGYSGDGGLASSAMLNSVSKVAVDTLGNVYIPDYKNHRIRMVNSNGIISTIVGIGTAGYSGDGGKADSAELNGPDGITIDKSGNIFIVDFQNNRIRKVNASGIISTYAGDGIKGFYGDGGDALLAGLRLPAGVAVDTSGNLYICDWGNNTIRKVSFVPLQMPKAIIDSIIKITAFTADIYGRIVFNGGDSIVKGGLCYNISQNPTIADTTDTYSGQNVGSFNIHLSQLIPNTTYYARAYATNKFGTSYGSQLIFKTDSLLLPKTTTNSFILITPTSAQGFANISFDGNDTIVKGGFCYGKSANPTILDKNTGFICKGVTSFSVTLAQLDLNSTYYVRAYATNAAGTAYGSQIQFTTPASLPILKTDSINYISFDTAVGYGTIIGNINYPKTKIGFCVDTSKNPIKKAYLIQQNNFIYDSISGIGTFTITFSNLSHGTKYYVRTFLATDTATFYGNQIQFVTDSNYWSTISIPSIISQEDCSGVYFSNKDTGYVVTSYGKLFKTTNGGKNWILKFQDSIGFFNSVVFPTQDTGYIVGWHGSANVYRTTDAGDNWVYKSVTIMDLSAVYFFNGHKGIVKEGNNNTNLYATNDGGDSWTVPCFDIHGSSSTKAIAFPSDSIGYVIGYYLMKTRDGGKTWQQLSTYGYYNAIAFTDTATGYITDGCCGGRPSILKTIDGGNTWVAQNTGTSNISINSIYFVNKNIGYAVGKGGLILKTINGGNSWKIQYSGTTNDLYDMHFPDANTGYIVGANGTILKTVQIAAIGNDILPSVITNPVIGITSTTAHLYGNITNDGNNPNVKGGFCYSSSQNPTINDSITGKIANGIGVYSTVISNLLPNTVYYVRAYATNNAGTAYGNQMQFSTSNCYSHYTTAYDTLQNTFTLMVDSATTAFANTYHWDFGDGSSSILATPTHVYALDSVYNVCLKITNSVNDTCSYCHLIGKDYLGNIYRTNGFTINVINSNLQTGEIPHLLNANRFIVYPNPTNGLFTLQMSKVEQVQVKIFNVIGECVYQNISISSNQQIDLTSQLSGIYTMQLRTEQGVINKKIVISH